MSALTKMFKPKMPVVPTPQAPAVMPDTDSTAALQAKRRALEASMRRGGRQSTILTDTARTTGSDDYSSPTLG